MYDNVDHVSSFVSIANIEYVQKWEHKTLP